MVQTQHLEAAPRQTWGPHNFNIDGQRAWQRVAGAVVNTLLQHSSRAADLDGVAEAGAGTVQLQRRDVTRPGTCITEGCPDDCLHRNMLLSQDVTCISACLFATSTASAASKVLVKRSLTLVE